MDKTALFHNFSKPPELHFRRLFTRKQQLLASVRSFRPKAAVGQCPHGARSPALVRYFGQLGVVAGQRTGHAARIPHKAALQRGICRQPALLLERAAVALDSCSGGLILVRPFLG